jgi:uncharacterized protein (TIGR02444 family)
VIGVAADRARPEALWRFSLMVYSRPGIAASLIALQDHGGHNVNLILYALWLAICGGCRLDAAGLARARGAIAGLDQAVVAPLRRLRRELKGAPDSDIQDMRQRVLTLEIDAERGLQARLSGLPPPRRGAKPSARGALAEANLRLILGADFDGPEAETLRRLSLELSSGST